MLRMILIIILTGINVTKCFNRRDWPGWVILGAYHWGAIGDGRGSLLVSHDPPFIRLRLEATAARLAIGRSS